MEAMQVLDRLSTEQVKATIEERESNPAPTSPMPRNRKQYSRVDKDLRNTDIMTAGMASEYLHCGVDTIYELVNRGLVERRTNSRGWYLFQKADLDRIKKKHMIWASDSRGDRYILRPLHDPGSGLTIRLTPEQVEQLKNFALDEGEKQDPRSIIERILSSSPR